MKFNLYTDSKFLFAVRLYIFLLISAVGIMLFLIIGGIQAAYAGQIDKNVTLPIINQSDQAAVRIEIWKINVEDRTVWARLYDKDYNLIVSNRVYAFDGGYKNIPITLLPDEIEYLDGQNPTEEWNIKTIKLWMDDRQAKDEDGKVSPDDPYYYEGDVIKDDLLSKVLEK